MEKGGWLCSMMKWMLPSPFLLCKEVGDRAVTKSPVPFMFFENWILEACGPFGSLEPEQ